MTAPAGPVTAAPPLLGSDGPDRSGRALARGRARRAAAGFAAHLVAHPRSLRAAEGLVESGLRIGALRWLEGFLEAARRRMPTAAVLLAGAETALRRGRAEVGIRRIRAAARRRPGSMEIRLAEASAGTILGDATAPWRAFATGVSAEGIEDQRTAYRRARLLALLQPRGLGTTGSWSLFREALRSGDPGARLRAELLYAALEETLGGEEEAGRAAARALDLGVRVGDRTSSAIALGSRVGTAAVPVGNRHRFRTAAAVSSCRLLPAHSRALLLDCWLSVLDRLKGRTDLDAAVALYRRLMSPILDRGNPFLILRLADGALPTLEAAGLVHEGRRLAAAAKRAAEAVNRRGLASRFTSRRTTATSGVGGMMPATEEDRRFALRMAREVASASETDAAMTLLTELLAARGAEDDGRRGRARSLYRRAFEGWDRWMAGVDDPAVRASMLDAWIELRTRAVEGELSAGRVEEALTLLELAREPGSGSRPVSRRPGVVGGREAILVYAGLGGSLWVFGLRAGATDAMRLPVSPKQIGDRVALWRAAVETADDRRVWLRTGSWLAERILHPVREAGWLEGVERIVVIPDGALHALPFAALPWSRDGRILYGDRRVWARAPSLALLEAARKRQPSGAGVVAFGPGGSADAAAEVRSVPGRSFLGPRATESRWRRWAGGARTLHFAGHAVLPTGPLRGGGLRLRGDRLHDGMLDPEEILRVELPGSLVVLFGCDTASRPPDLRRTGATASPTSLGEAFLRAGARSVIGNLWPVTDRTARRIAEQFYALGGPDAGANGLARARRRLRQRWPLRPAIWAGAVWIGAPDPATTPP